jgi:hypothetical protein
MKALNTGEIKDECDIIKARIRLSAYRTLVKKVEEGSLDAAIYGIDRVEGKPRATVDNKLIIGLDSDLAKILQDAATKSLDVAQARQNNLLAPFSIEAEYRQLDSPDTSIGHNDTDTSTLND